jgi:hypothetical protein
MSQHHKNLLVLSGHEKPVSIGRILSGSTYPYMQFEKDTWRKKTYFEEAKIAFEKDDDKSIWQIVKKVWVDFNISTRSERVRMTKQGRLNPEYLLSLCKDNCPCCGRAMWYGRVHNFVEGYQKPSLDRLDPAGGYVNENVWIICLSCNTKKNNSQNPMELVKLALAWHKMMKSKLEEYDEYVKEFPSLEGFFK